jgi:hypothetical protein
MVLFFITLYFSSYIQISNMQVFSNKLSSFPFLDSKSVHIRNTIPKSQIQKLKRSYFFITLYFSSYIQISNMQVFSYNSFIFLFFVDIRSVEMILFVYEKVTLFGFFYAIFLFFLVFLNLRIKLHRFRLKIYCLNS